MQSPRDLQLEVGLFLLRLSCAGLFLVWAIDKLINPAHAAKVFEVFYFSEISNEISLGLGIAQLLIILMFLFGLFKFFSYGALFLMHLVSVSSTWEKLIAPYDAPRDILFWGAVPVVPALLLLFLVRERDRLFSLDQFWR